MDAIGRDGRQATLPRESSTHEEASDRFQGSWRIPRVINQSKMISSSGDSVAPVMAFISWLLASKCRNTSFSCAERNLLFVSDIEDGWYDGEADKYDETKTNVEHTVAATWK